MRQPLEEEGFTGRIISDLLLEDMKSIHALTKSRVRSGLAGQPAPDDSPLLGEVLLQHATLPGTGISMDTLTDFILEALGKPSTKISGNLRHAGESVILTLRTGHRTQVLRSPAGVSCAEGCIEEILQEAAQQVYLDLDPYALALYHYGHDSIRCERAIRHCLTSEPPTYDAAAYNLWGLLLKSRGDIHGAERKFLRALNLLKPYRENRLLAAAVYSNWGALLARQNRFTLAREKYEKSAKIDPSYAEALFNWGMAWQQEAKFPEAAEKYREAMRVNPRLLAAYNNLSYVLSQMGDWDGAFKTLGLMEGITQHRDPEVYGNWGFLLIKRKRFTEAIDKYDQSLDLNPDYIPAYRGKAYAYYELGNLPAAQENLTRLKELTTQHSSGTATPP